MRARAAEIVDLRDPGSAQVPHLVAALSAIQRRDAAWWQRLEAAPVVPGCHAARREQRAAHVQIETLPRRALDDVADDAEIEIGVGEIGARRIAGVEMLGQLEHF